MYFFGAEKGRKHVLKDLNGQIVGAKQLERDSNVQIAATFAVSVKCMRKTWLAY